jgi:hypothetical protein
VPCLCAVAVMPVPLSVQMVQDAIRAIEKLDGALKRHRPVEECRLLAHQVCLPFCLPACLPVWLAGRPSVRPSSAAWLASCL